MNRKGAFTLTADGVLSGDITEVFSGDDATSERWFIKENDSKELHDKLEQGLGSDLPGVAFKGFEFPPGRRPRQAARPRSPSEFQGLRSSRRPASVGASTGLWQATPVLSLTLWKASPESTPSRSVTPAAGTTPSTSPYPPDTS